MLFSLVGSGLHSDRKKEAVSLGGPPPGRNRIEMRLDIRTTNVNGVFVATCPSLPGCTTRGTSMPDTLDRHAAAIWGYLASVTNFLPSRLELHVDGNVFTSTPPEKSPTRLSA
jgi:predicted RNase H-like HicB family nuclease